MQQEIVRYVKLKSSCKGLQLDRGALAEAIASPANDFNEALQAAPAAQSSHSSRKQPTRIRRMRELLFFHSMEFQVRLHRQQQKQIDHLGAIPNVILRMC
jgi:hypothetical protein